MVIFHVAGARPPGVSPAPVDRAPGVRGGAAARGGRAAAAGGRRPRGLDERHVARDSQDAKTDASPHRSSVQAWIEGGEGSIVMRSRRMAGVGRAPGDVNNGIPEGEIGIAPLSGNPLWTSVGLVATLTLCAAC
ncbi:hypothetical protein GCM10010218_43210 [Streptomyces mashuensis]|uniref:Uncharacterized protein n=1 Tax=Streptomyces mashuensis TaxID=33904 RepID=A0A919B704_9ACTN|nr:hypothetical protein GCM10010218_43210 [Streptomyces mashuensis]